MLLDLSALQPGCVKPEPAPQKKNEFILGVFVGVAAGVCNGEDLRSHRVWQDAAWGCAHPKTAEKGKKKKKKKKKARKAAGDR